MKAGLEKGRQPPEWYLDEPYVPLGCEVFIGWFWELSTERAIGFSVGPIPFSKIRDLCRWRGFDYVVTRAVMLVVGAMDNAYMLWVQDQTPNSGGPAPPSIDEGAPRWPSRNKTRG